MFREGKIVAVVIVMVIVMVVVISLSGTFCKISGMEIGGIFKEQWNLQIHPNTERRGYLATQTDRSGQIVCSHSLCSALVRLCAAHDETT